MGQGGEEKEKVKRVYYECQACCQPASNAAGDEVFILCRVAVCGTGCPDSFGLGFEIERVFPNSFSSAPFRVGIYTLWFSEKDVLVKQRTKTVWSLLAPDQHCSVQNDLCIESFSSSPCKETAENEVIWQYVRELGKKRCQKLNIIIRHNKSEGSRIQAIWEFTILLWNITWRLVLQLLLVKRALEMGEHGAKALTRKMYSLCVPR